MAFNICNVLRHKNEPYITILKLLFEKDFIKSSYFEKSKIVNGDWVCVRNNLFFSGLIKPTINGYSLTSKGLVVCHQFFLNKKIVN